MVDYDIFDPYPHYAWLHTQGTVLPDGPNGWIVIGFAEAGAALKDERLSADKFPGPDNPLGAVFSRQMVFTDAPTHTRLRSLVTRAFTPRVIEGLRETITTLTEGFLDDMAAQATQDIIRDLAYPLPVTVIAEMLGIPADDRPIFKRWSDDFFEALEVWPEGERAERLQESFAEFTAYIRARIEPLRQNPRADLLSALIAAHDAGDRLTEDELLANVLLLLAAGHETTTNLIGNGTLALLEHAEARAALRADDTLLAPAVEEMLRYDSPVQWTGRIAKQPIRLGGQTIPAGGFVSICLGGANRDPKAFPEPNGFRIERPPTRHLAFGFGPHYCLGAALARLEGEIVFRALLRRFPHIALAEAPQWLPLTTFRALHHLSVRLH
jgi:cytochrome P450